MAAALVLTFCANESAHFHEDFAILSPISAFNEALMTHAELLIELVLPVSPSNIASFFDVRKDETGSILFIFFAIFD